MSLESTPPPPPPAAALPPDSATTRLPGVPKAALSRVIVVGILVSRMISLPSSFKKSFERLPRWRRWVEQAPQLFDKLARAPGSCRRVSRAALSPSASALRSGAERTSPSCRACSRSTVSGLVVGRNAEAGALPLPAATAAATSPSNFFDGQITPMIASDRPRGRWRNRHEVREELRDRAFPPRHRRCSSHARRQTGRSTPLAIHFVALSAELRSCRTPQLEVGNPGDVVHSASSSRSLRPTGWRASGRRDPRPGSSGRA